MTQVLSRTASIQRPASLMTAVFQMLSVYRQRRALLRLDAQGLADIGLTRQQAESEARRPLWDVSVNCR